MSDAASKGFIAHLTFDDGEQMQFRVTGAEFHHNAGPFRLLFEARIKRERQEGRASKVARWGESP